MSDTVSLDSNADAVGAGIARLLDTFDFTRPGADGSLGRDLVNTVARGIVARSVPAAKAPDQSAWPDNESAYAKWKRQKYGAIQPNVRTGQMLSLASVKGQPEIGPDTVVLRYGTGTPPSATSTGAALSDSDKDITDIEKAFFCSKDRPFYALDATINAAAIAEAEAALDDHLKGNP